MTVFQKFFAKEKSSKIAKDRLKLVLIHDRANVSPEFLEMIKDEIMQVLLKYMEVSSDEMDIHLTKTTGGDGVSIVPALTANIPISNMKPIKKN